MIPGKTTLRTNETRGKRKRLNTSNFCHSASGDWKIVVVSLIRLALRVVRSEVRWAPIGQPKYLHRYSHDSAGMVSAPKWGENRGIGDCLFNMQREPHFLALKVSPAHSANATQRSRRDCMSDFLVATMHTSSAYARELMVQPAIA